jgi:flagellar motor component MotA
MLWFFLQIIGFVIFIISIHYLWNIFKDKFTTKKTKYLNSTIEKYKLLMETTTNNEKIYLEEINTDNNATELIEADLNQFIDEIMHK